MNRSHFTAGPHSRIRRTASVLVAALLATSGGSLARAAADEAVGAQPYVPVPAELLERVLRGIELNFEGDLDGADAIWATLRAERPDHPLVPVNEVNTIYWRQTFDERNTEFDAAIQAKSDEAIRLGRAMLAANPDDADAHFYIGQALMHQARLELVRDRIVAAGGRGEEGRKHLERALELRPDMVDAKHHLGMYYFYAGILPSVMKLLSWLWFVPKGDTELGLQYLEEAQRAGVLHEWDARFISLNIKTYLAPDLETALVLARDLHSAFPDNSVFHFELIEVLSERKDAEGVIAESLALESHPGSGYHDAGRRRMARVWRAGAELELGRTRRAWEALEPFGPEGPDEPNWASAWINLTRGRILDVQGDRPLAVIHYQRVRDLEPPKSSPRASELAKQYMEEPYELEKPALASAGP